jgi:hypothetical protein
VTLCSYTPITESVKLAALAMSTVESPRRWPDRRGWAPVEVAEEAAKSVLGVIVGAPAWSKSQLMPTVAEATG